MTAEQLPEIREPCEPGLQNRRRHREQLPPVGHSVVGRELLLDQREQPDDAVPVRLPGRMESYTSPVVTRAHPKTVRVDGAYLGNVQVRRDPPVQLLDRHD